MTKLCDELAGALKYSDIEIPSHITHNLNKELRLYQQTALKHYLLQRKNPQTNHLMFNMATGSGKTLIMAALMLDLYKQGYLKFVFFVNSTAILEKTKANFCDKASSKYLFNEKILIDSKEVAVKSVANFEECDENAINIYFSTIQGLFSLFRNERENSLTLADLENHKIVFIADEAHHLNSETKQANKIEADIKIGWESVMKSAFHSNANNLMLEFTATIPKEKAILDKYKDKIVFEFDLKEFCKGGFSKRIFLVKYESTELKDRFLGATILSVFRQELARKNGIKLKPVTLFKSETIGSSKDNQALFGEIVENLNADEIADFYANLSGNNQLFSNAKDFFTQEFGENFYEILAKLIKTAFKKEFLFNANDDVEKYQIKLNTLEDDDNEIRAIFAVDKLNEGWDVLNLFDIVRLGAKKATAKTTTAEVQLIGRGARYFPFEDKDLFDDTARKFVRKFDNDGNHKMASLEILSYHSFNDVAFISDLEKGMRESGVLFDDEKEKFVLTPTKHGKAVKANNKIYYAKNKRKPYNKKQSDLFDKRNKEEIKREVAKNKVPYFSHNINESEISFEEKGEQKNFSGCLKLNQKVNFGVFNKALNQLNITFADIRDFYQCESKKDFYRQFGEIELQFDRRQEFSLQNQLAIAKFILQNFKELKEKIKPTYEVTPFYLYEMEQLGERVIYRNKDSVQNSPYEWLYYDKYSLDSNLESEFLEFIEAHKEQISAKFCEWFILRNDGFDEFKIYDHRELIDDEKNPSYAVGFEPDFIFFGKKDENSNYLSVQCFFEPKGGHLAGWDNDKWKEAFLSEIDGMKFDKVLSEKGTAKQLNLNFDIMAFPFFLGNQVGNQKFEEKFAKIFGGE
ncbi:MAG: DEAD/DEAH box helicase family protein [Cardiobacteriaceae bacterium]|nr:DEAD/DEAH box helicase family protein [Cardiobacteriaceae bacterium]